MTSPTVTIIPMSREELCELIKEHSRPASAVAPLLYTKKQAAAALNVSEWTIQQLMRSGELPYIKRDRDVRIAVADLHAWIERQREVAPGSYTDPSHDGR